MNLVEEVQAYKGIRCHPILLLLEGGSVNEKTRFIPSLETIEILKEEGENFIAVILAMDAPNQSPTNTRPLASTLRAMPRELWYISWLEIAGIPEVIVAHRGIEGETLKELGYYYDRMTNRIKGKNAQRYGRLIHTVDIDLLLINPELWERITQAEQEGA